MNALTKFIKAKKDLSSKSPAGYEYEVEIRLKDVTEKEFMKLSKISNAIITEETLYSVKGSSTVTIREINSEFFIKEKISSKVIPELDAEMVLSLERKYLKEEGMALKIKRHKERYTIDHKKFKIDLTKVTSGSRTHYEIEFEVTHDDCELKQLELAIKRIRSSATLQVSRLVNKLVPSLDLRNYMFPKPIDITVKELVNNYSLGGSVSLKLDGTRSFLACYEKNVYAISTKGEETIIDSDVDVYHSLTLFDTETVDDVYYAFDIVILNGVAVTNQPLKERTRLIPQACIKINKAVKKRLIVAKRHFMFKSFSTFSRHHYILHERIQENKYDGLIYTHSGSYFDPVMRWKPQKTVDLLYQEGILMVYNKGENVDSKIRISQDSNKPREGVVSEFIVKSNKTVVLLRERKDKMYPNSITVVRRIISMANDEEDMLNVFKGLTVSVMRSYHNKVKRDLLRKGSGHLLDVGSGRGGDIAKWSHYRSVTCVEPFHANIKEFKRRLGTNAKINLIQTKIEHLRGLEKSVTTLSCFFCITLIDIAKLVSVAQRVFSDKSKCTFLCIVMSKKYVIEFLEARDTREYTCKAYSIKLDSNDKIFIHIPGTIVLNQTESLVDVDELILQFNSIGLELETRNRLSGSKFMSSDEYLLSCMYEYIVMTKSK